MPSGRDDTSYIRNAVIQYRNHLEYSERPHGPGMNGLKYYVVWLCYMFKITKTVFK